MTHRAGLVLALVRLLLSATGEAASAHSPAQATLSVSKKATAHSCPSEKELRRDVAAILGYVPFHAGARRRIAAVLWATDGTFHARIQLLDTRTHKTLGRRELSATGPTCEALSSAMALAIALAIDPLAQPPPPKLPPAAPPPAAVPSPAPRRPTAAAPAVAPGVALAETRQVPKGAPALSEPPVFAVAAEDAGPPETAALGAGAGGEADAGTAVAAPVPPNPPVAVDTGTALAADVAPPAPDAGTPADAVVAGPVPPAEPAGPAAAAPSAAAPREGGFHGLLGAGADVTVGLVPSTAFGAVLHGGVAWTFASAELELRWLPSTSTAFEAGSISTTLLTGALVGCATFQSFGALSACGLFEAGPFTSKGHGYAESLSTTTWTAALGVRGQWDWVFVHPVGLRVHVDGLVNLVRTRLLVGPDVAWQAPNVALDVGVGLLLVF